MSVCGTSTSPNDSYLPTSFPHLSLETHSKSTTVTESPVPRLPFQHLKPEILTPKPCRLRLHPSNHLPAGPAHLQLRRHAGFRSRVEAVGRGRQDGGERWRRGWEEEVRVSPSRHVTYHSASISLATLSFLRTDGIIFVFAV